MKCSKCGHENRSAAKFCEECAAPLTRTCANCGSQLSATAKFCPECAHPATTAKTGQGQLVFPQTYTPRHLAEKILNSKTALEGERKQVTILFADLKGSTELLADRDPEDARKLLDPVLQHMMEAVHRYEGTVSNVMGDGVMALFGAPLAHEDHAVRACYAALRMQELVKRYAHEIQRIEGVPIQIRVGLNSGEVVVRSIGSDLRMDYSAVGQTTHLAARMEQTAMPGSILLTGDTLQLVEGFVQVKPLGPVRIKGLGQPVQVFELTEAAAVRSRFQAAAARGLTRFVGRQAELRALQRALTQASAGHGQMVAPVGEPGVGKSRLFWEFTHSHRVKGWTVLESGSVSYGKATSYLPIIDLLKAYCGIEARDDARAIREKVTGKLLALDKALESTLPAFLTLLDVEVQDPVWQALDPPRRRQRTLDAIKRLLLREAQEQPLLLVFEDLHWIDSETQALLDSLVESLPTARILLLVNYRPEYEHRWGNKSYCTQLRLDPLGAESAEELLRALLGDNAELDSLRRLLIEQTEGSPLFLEESVRTLVETHVLEGERGAYRSTRRLANIEVPATVQAVLAARIDRLAVEDKRLLQAAAVIGKDVPFALLQAIADEPEPQLQASLAHLQGAEFLYEASLFPELEYTFKHALTHDVAYRGLLQERRQVLHARIVEAIELLHADRLEEQVERLAQHAQRGEVWDKALVYCRQAGLRALGRSVHREASAWFEKGLLTLEHLPQTRELQEQAIDIRLDLPRTLLPLGEIERLVNRLGEAETIAEGLGDRRRLGRVAAFQAGSLWWVAEYKRGAEAARRALAISEEVGDVAICVVGSYYLAMNHFIPGDFRRGAEILKSTAALLTGELIRERFGGAGYPAVMTHAWLSFCLAEQGQFAEAVASGQEAVRIAELLDHPYSVTHACLELGGVYIRKGEPSKAIPILERAFGLCRTWDLPIWVVGIDARLGLAYVLAGRTAEALPLLEQAAQKAIVPKLLIYPVQAYLAALIAEANVLANRQDDGLIKYGLELARQRTEPGNEASLLRLLGEMASRRDPPDVETAEKSYGRAVALAQDLGMRPLQAQCHLGLGSLYRRTGRGEVARSELFTACEMFRAMEMQSWLSQAEMEMRHLG